MSDQPLPAVGSTEWVAARIERALRADQYPDDNLSEVEAADRAWLNRRYRGLRHTHSEGFSGAIRVARTECVLMIMAATAKLTCSEPAGGANQHNEERTKHDN